MADPSQVSPARWAQWWREWPLEHLAGKAGFVLSGDRFELRKPPAPDDAEVLVSLINELVDWRMSRYLANKEASGSETALIKVLRAGDRPILGLLRENNPGLPEGRDIPVNTDLGWMTFDFMKVAVNVARTDDSGPNVLGDLLRGWFGPQAGAPGTDHQVRLWQQDDGWHASPVRATDALKGSAG